MTDPLCPQQHTHPKHNPNRCIFCEYGVAVRADERERIQSEALDAITMHVLTGEDRAAFLYRLDRILNPEWKP